MQKVINVRRHIAQVHKSIKKEEVEGIIKAYNDLNEEKTVVSKLSKKVNAKDRSTTKTCCVCDMTMKRLDVHINKYHAKRNTPGNYFMRLTLTFLFHFNRGET